MNIPERTLQSWKKETENNQHTDVRIDIADFFGYGTLSNLFLMIRRRQDEIGFLEPHLQEIRYYATNLLLGCIEAEFGETVYENVKSCL